VVDLRILPSLVSRITRRRFPGRRRSFRLRAASGPALLVCLALLASPNSFPQQAAHLELPDAPSPTAEADPTQTVVPPPTQPQQQQPVFKIGPFRDPKALDLSMPVVPLTVGDKLRLSFQEQATPFAVASMVFAAGWEQLVDSNPKYGTDSAAYAQRVGAAALRQTSQAVFSDGIFASAFHEDPRFYRLVQGTTGKRILYAATRTFRTRTDSGAPTTNYALLFGHATAQALTLTYYPDRSQNGRVAGTGFAWSLFGNMLGNQYHEFFPDILKAILQRPPVGPKPTSGLAESKQLPAR